MISMLQLLLPCPLFLNLVDSRTKKTSGLGHMSKDVHQVTGVLIVEVWAVVPEVFLPCLSHQMGVLGQMPPDGFSSTLCEEA